MSTITVEIWSGRTVEQKKALAKDLTEQFTGMGVPLGEDLDNLQGQRQEKLTYSRGTSRGASLMPGSSHQPV